MDAFGITGVAARLSDRFNLLKGGRRTALPRHQGLGATLDWSYGLLAENERAVLRPGSFARVEIVTDAGQPVVTVPFSSVIVFAGVEKVLIVRQGRTAEVRVTTGRRLGDDVEILEGLKRGEPVVGLPGNLTGGQPVTVAR